MNQYISVIIPTRNRSTLLKNALLSIDKQTLSEDCFEVIIIDNGSTDDTKIIAQEHINKHSNARYFFCPEPGLHIGRHKGLTESAGDILVYIDDDIEATPSWLNAIADSFQPTDIAMVGGNNFPKFVTPPPSWLLKLWNQNKGKLKYISSLSILEIDGSEQELDPMLIWGCNFAIRKNVLFEARGFHPDGMPEHLIKFRGDGETHISQFVKNSNYRAIFNPKASVFHLVTPGRMTHDYFRKRSYNQGVSDSYSILRTASRLKQLQRTTILIQYTKKMLKLFLRGLKAHLIPDKEIRLLNQLMVSGYREGYKFHHHQFKIDDEIKSWVCKNNYL